MSCVRDTPHRRRRAVVCCALILTLGVWALPTEAAKKKRPRPWVESSQLPTPVTPPYRLNVADKLEVSFLKTTELNRIVTVGPDGAIHLPIIGAVQVVGLTVDDLTRLVTERYKLELVQPQISVLVAEYSGLNVYVGGEVHLPGVIPYRGGVTAVQALVQAGGFRDTARLKQVILIRQGDSDKPVGHVINVKKILKNGRFNADVPLAPSDILFVPKSRIANVNLFVEQYIINLFPIPRGIGVNLDL